MTKSPEEKLRSELEKVAPGTALRQGLDFILSASNGALVVLGDVEKVPGICSGGIEINAPFTPQNLYELAKMDGAIILDEECGRILRANVHLVPDAELPTIETGMRHRAAERVSRQTDALVIAISQRRRVVSLYLGGAHLILEYLDEVLTKANQALQTLLRYRASLDETLARLTALEFDDLVTVGDLAGAVSRFEMVRRVSDEVNRYISALGTEGRLVRMQADELTAGVTDEYLLLLRDYAVDSGARKAGSVRTHLARLTPDQVREPALVAETLGLPSDVQSAEDHVSARGYRVLKRIPSLPASVVSRIVEQFGSLAEILRAGVDDLDDVDGVGTRRAAAIADGLSRMRGTL
jgi:diadenylate cyclase